MENVNKLYLCVAYIRYFLYALICLSGNIFVWVFSSILPILPAFSFFTKDNQLPKFLKWCQTHDNPIDGLWLGDEGAGHRAGDYDHYPWLFKHTNEEISKSFYLKYRARAAWLFRNPAYGLAHSLGFKDRNAKVIYKTQWGIQQVNNANWGFYRIYDSGKGLWNRYAFTYRAAYIFKPVNLFGIVINKFFVGRYFRQYIGFKSVGSFENSPNLIVVTHLNPFRKTAKI